VTPGPGPELGGVPGAGVGAAVAALSVHPVAAAATGEVVGEVLERLGGEPSVVLAFVSHHHAESLGAIADTVGDLLHPGVLLAAGVEGTAAGIQGVLGVPSVVLWAARGPACQVLHLGHPSGATGGWEGLDAVPHEGTFLALAAPGDDRLTGLLATLGATREDLGVAGALWAAGQRVVGTGLPAGGVTSGVAGVVFPAGVATVVRTSGCRTLGPPMVVTEAEGRFITGLAGAPALGKVTGVLESLGDTDRRAARDGLYALAVVDHHADEPGPGDYLPHRILGAAPPTGGVALETGLPVGTVVHLGVRDANSVTSELAAAVATVAGGTAVVASGAARARLPLGDPDSDAGVVSGVLGTTTVAGVVGGSAFGTVAGGPWQSAAGAAVVVMGTAGAPPR